MNRALNGQHQAELLNLCQASRYLSVSRWKLKKLHDNKKFKACTEIRGKCYYRLDRLQLICDQFQEVF
jgi:hypothetical protein